VSARRRPRAEKLSRRRFVSLLAAGSAAVLASPVAGAQAPKPAPSAAQKEFDRQLANTKSALKTIREYKLPPGGDLPVVFRPLGSPRRSR
jgi:hypothetical protein